MACALKRMVQHYELIDEVGRGGMAVVYRARQRAPERHVALKELSSFHSASPAIVERFLRESQLAGSLNHNHIVTVYECFEHAGVPYIAMEYLPRGSLRPSIGSMTFPQFVGVMEGVLFALGHVEQRGVVHRDIKPENVLVTDDGEVKITDFGIAKASVTVGLGSIVTQDGMTAGTPTYMAPEQALGSKQIGPWTDLYSVGVMAYEHFAGQPPFTDDAAAVVLFRNVNDTIPPLTDVDPCIDVEVSDWVDRLLVKEPRRRTRSPLRAWKELEDIAIRRCGARWRDEARLPAASSTFRECRPLTPEPFDSNMWGRLLEDGPTPNLGDADRYLTFSSRPGDSGGNIPAPLRPVRSPLSQQVLAICDGALRALPAGATSQAVERIRQELERVREAGDPLQDARSAGDGLARLELLSWTHSELRALRDRIEAVRERGAEMQLVRLAGWYERQSAGDVFLSVDQRQELERLLRATSPAERLGVNALAGEQAITAAARARASAWRSFEAGAFASPMARRLAADVVRFYEEMTRVDL